MLFKLAGLERLKVQGQWARFKGREGRSSVNVRSRERLKSKAMPMPRQEGKKGVLRQIMSSREKIALWSENVHRSLMFIAVYKPNLYCKLQSV